MFFIFYSLFIACILFSGHYAQADPIETSQWVYHVSRESYFPGQTAKLIRSGEHASQPRFTWSPQIEDGSTLDGTLRHLEGYLRSQNDSIAAERARIIDRIRSPDQNNPGLDHYSIRDENRMALPAQPFSLELFLACAKDSLPKLKKLLKTELNIPQADARTQIILGALSRRLRQPLLEERGNAGQIDVSGVTCGKFLGLAGFPSQGLEEDIKFLSAITLRRNPDVQVLLKAAIAAHHSRAPASAKQLWALYWRYLSLHAVFSEEDLPTLNALQEKVRTAFQNESIAGQGLVFVLHRARPNSINPIEIPQRTLEGLQFAEGVLR